jgi:hypothetical protein
VSECGLVQFLGASRAAPALENLSVRESITCSVNAEHFANASVWAFCRSKSGHKQRVTAKTLLVTASVSHENISSGGYSAVCQTLPNQSHEVLSVETKIVFIQRDCD